MGRLVLNECIKILNKKITIIFLSASILTLFISYGIIYLQKEYNSKNPYLCDSIEIMQLKVSNLKNKLKEPKIDKEIIDLKIEIYEYAIKNDIRIRSIGENYKSNIVLEIIDKINFLEAIDKDIMNLEYLNELNNINSLKELLYSNDFENYIQFEKNKLKKEFNNKILTEEDYKKQINELDLKLKYEIGKFNTRGVISWKLNLINNNMDIDNTINLGYDYSKKEFLTNDKILKLQEQQKINLYRLDNDLPPNHLLNSQTNLDSYYRWSYDNLALKIAIIIITILFIILSSSSISEEVSSGTIKLLLISPFKRFEILLSKLLSFIIILISIITLLSQFNVLIDNIVFSNAVNNYIYVNDNNIQILSSNTYIILQYILQIPSVLIYILIGITLSTLTRSSIIANTITLVTYIGFPILIDIMQGSIKMDFLKYIPFNNFDLKSKLFYFDISKSEYVFNTYKSTTTLQFSIIVLSITTILLLITMFESFNKRNIK